MIKEEVHGKISQSTANNALIDSQQYCFQLAGFSNKTTTALQKEMNKSYDAIALQDEINLALHPMIDQMPFGISLVIEYECLSLGNGSMSLACQIYLDFNHKKNTLTKEKKQTLQNELTVCLSMLSDHFTFRRIDLMSKNTSKVDYKQKVFVYPESIACISKGKKIGFTQSQDVAANLYLPALDARKIEFNSLSQIKWPDTLAQVFKAARTINYPLKFSVKLTKEPLDKKLKNILQRFLKNDVDLFNLPEINNDNVFNNHSSLELLTVYIKTMLNESTDLMRIDIEAQTIAQSQHSESVLRVLAAEIFPDREVKVIDHKQLLQRQNKKITDLSNLYPISAGLPPILPRLTILETLNFPRHFNNPSVDLPSSGLLLGNAHIGGFEYPVYMEQEERSRHMYMLGATGTGKSTLLYNLICQDMEAGHGVAVMDPHGDLFDQVLEAVPKHRKSDVVLIDPSDEDLTVGLNPLDFGDNFSLLEINKLTNDLLDIFNHLYNMNEAGGPMFETFFRNCMLVASAANSILPDDEYQPEQATMLTVMKIMREGKYLKKLREYCENVLGKEMGQSVNDFFTAAMRQDGEHSLENFNLYITSKLTPFTYNPVLRRLLCQPKKTIDFRKIMDDKKILLVNLNKGELGKLDVQMIGMLITKYIFHAAMSRSDIPKEERTPFYFYLDEFQNFVSSDIPDVLAESRKYGLHMTLAHQTLSQLLNKGNNSVLNSILGNVATKLIFRVGKDEAQSLASHFVPHFNDETLTTLPDWSVIARILLDNKPSSPFVFQTVSPK